MDTAPRELFPVAARPAGNRRAIDSSKGVGRTDLSWAGQSGTGGEGPWEPVRQWDQATRSSRFLYRRRV